jgi:CubicO group peptidase (beta-lactamase class C family)
MKRTNTSPRNFHLLSILIAVVLSFSYSQTVAGSDIKTESPESIDELIVKVDSLIKIEKIPGVALALVSKDSIIWAGGIGLANLDTGEPVTENTQFRIGSCTKSFIGLGFLKLIEEGRIDLNTPVKEIAPEIEILNPWQETHPVRVVHLLEHTAGFDDSHLNWFYFKGPVKSLQKALEDKADWRKVRWQPGTRFSYSSPGYTLAGYIMQKVCGQRYDEYIKQVILDPIGMKTSTIGRTSENKELLAVGYGDDLKPVPYWYDYEEPAGAMNSSVKEIALFLQFMLNRGRVGDKQLIKNELFDRVGQSTTTIAARAGVGRGYSFGIGTRYRNNQVWYAHGGLVPGFNVEYAYNLDCGVGYVVMINRFGRFIYSDIIDLVERFIACNTKAPVIQPFQVSESQLKNYCGYYELRSSRIQLARFMDILIGGVTISFENDTLYQKYFDSGKIPLIPVSQNMFRLSHEPVGSRVFSEATDGKMIYATSGSYFERTASWKPLVYRVLYFGAFTVMLSSIVYSIFWIPVYLYKRLKKKGNRARYLRMRIIPLLAVLSIGLGCVMVANQTILELGQMTVRNIIFFISTLVFAGLSVLSLFFAYRSFFTRVKMIARIYAVILALSCFGITLYLGYWGIIGIRLWAY